jgi:uncharacterized membrane protein YoaK (UPF0700 family)
VPLAFVFAAIAGYADAIGYLRFKAFAGMMTGNTVLMGLAFFHRAELPARDYALVLAVFFATACAAYAALRLRCPPLLLLLAEGAALLLAQFFGGHRARFLLVMAMGLQNPLASRVGIALNTTFITGDILRFAEGLVGWITPGGRAPFAIYGLAWLGYALGAALGVAGLVYLPWPLLLPAAGLFYAYWQAEHGGVLTISGR